MKKFMIAAMTVCAAIFVHGAACDWSTYAYAIDEETALQGGTYWFISLGKSNNAFADLAVKSDGTLIGAKATGATIDSEFGAIEGRLEGLSSVNNGDFYAIVVWDGAVDGYYGKSLGQILGIVDEPPTDADPIAFDNGTTGSWGGTLANTAVVGPGPEPTPEPTSGLLILLGMAGLALKRKRT